jgi:hypothetical protein
MIRPQQVNKGFHLYQFDWILLLLIKSQSLGRIHLNSAGINLEEKIRILFFGIWNFMAPFGCVRDEIERSHQNQFKEQNASKLDTK